MNVVSRDPNEVNHLSQTLHTLLSAYFPGRLLGPEFPMVSRVRNEYYKRILVKVSRTAPPAQVREQIAEALARLQHDHRQWRYRTVVDVDPV